jgi:hypothetical protein
MASATARLAGAAQLLGSCRFWHRSRGRAPVVMKAPRLVAFGPRAVCGARASGQWQSDILVEWQSDILVETCHKPVWPSGRLQSVRRDLARQEGPCVLPEAQQNLVHPHQWICDDAVRPRQHGTHCSLTLTVTRGKALRRTCLMNSPLSSWRGLE